jgi:hypothetical protein
MNQVFLDTIYLFSCGARGVKPVLDHEIDVLKIHDTAVQQGIWDITFLAIKQLYDEGSYFVNGELIEKWHKELIIRIAKETQRSFQVYNIIKKLEDSGVNCCVLKGEIIADLYYNPDCRISTDTDILIDKAFEKKAVKIMGKNKFEVLTRSSASHHVRCFHPVAGLIELHVDLYDEIFEDIWFDNMINNKESCRRVTTSQGYEYTTLGITDGLIFITLHYIKHFLTCGVGIRQLMDVLLYMKKYKNEIDWDRLNGLLRHLKYYKFFSNAIGIGIEYLKFNKEELPEVEYDSDIMIKILDDVEEGGVYGKSNLQRRDFYKIYTEKRFEKIKNENYQKYMNKWKRSSSLKMIFPKAANLKVKFPYVTKSKLLLPVAWVHRLLRFVCDVFNRNKDVRHYIQCPAPQSNRALEKRMELIRELDMI